MMDKWRTGSGSEFATLWTGDTWFTNPEDDAVAEDNRSNEALEEQLQRLPGITKVHRTVKSSEGNFAWCRVHLEPRRQVLHPTEDIGVKRAPTQSA